MKFNKKAVTVIVAMSLLLVVAVSGFIFFQNWYHEYESKIFANVDTTSEHLSSDSEIVNLISNSLYFNNGYDELEVESVYLNSVDCNISMNLSSGIQVIPLDSCVGDFSGKDVEVEVITDKYVFSKDFYISDSSLEVLSSNVVDDGSFDCQFIPPFGFNGGVGTEGDPFEICSCLQLQNISNDFDSNYELVSDVDCSDTVNWNEGNGFSPIGFCGEGCDGLSGIFNGNNFTITDLFIDLDESNSVGLFGFLDGGSILNLGVESSIFANSGIGGLVGKMYGGLIDNSYTITTLIGINWGVGGLVGSISGGVINNSYSVCNITGSSSIGGLIGNAYLDGPSPHITVSNSHSISKIVLSSGEGSEYIGGLIGYTYNVNIDNSYSISEFSGGAGGSINKVGGLVGYLYYDSTIDNSYSNSKFNFSSQVNRVGGLIGAGDNSEISNSYSISEFIAAGGDSNVGGLIGYMNNVDLSNSYAVFNVSGSEMILGIGGLVGYLRGDSAINSYWDQDLYATSDSGSGLTTLQMKDESNYVGWDFTDVWDINSYSNDGYPFLKNVFEGSIDCEIDGQEVLNGSSITLYDSKYVTNLGDCNILERVCEYAVLSGDDSYEYSTCTMDCSYSDGEVLDGNSILTYFNSNVVLGNVCLNETRTCTSGVLSGTYDYLSCSIAPGKNCILGSKIVAHDDSSSAYLASKIPFGETCADPTLRACYDGSFNGDGNYTSGSCDVAYVDFNSHKYSANFDYGRGLHVVGDIGYILSTMDDKFSTWNLSDKSNPVQLDIEYSATYLNGARGIDIEGDIAYVVSFVTDVIASFNISDPSNIIYLNHYTSSFNINEPYDVEVENGVAYVASYAGKSLTTFDISDPTNIVYLDKIASSTYLSGASDVEISGDIAYVVNYFGASLSSFNISNSSDIIFLDEYKSTSYLQNPVDVKISGDSAFLVSTASGSYLTSLNISNPLNITLLDYEMVGNGPEAIEIKDNLAFVSSYSNINVYDISTPDDMLLLQTLTLDSDKEIFDLEIEGNYIYGLADEYLKIYDRHSTDYSGCYFPGDLKRVSEGETKTAFLQGIVPNDEFCQSISRTCSGNVLGGDENYIYGSCESIFFAGGDGSDSNPYVIENCEQLQSITYDVYSSYQLLNDIDCSESSSFNSGQGFIPVGNGEGCQYFRGSFYGNNFTISNLDILKSEWSNVGLFCGINSGTFNDVSIVNANIDGFDNVGIFAGNVQSGITFSNIFTNGTVTGNDNVGGIVGRGSCEDLSGFAAMESDATVTANSNSGQIIGIDMCE